MCLEFNKTGRAVSRMVTVTDGDFPLVVTVGSGLTLGIALCPESWRAAEGEECVRALLRMWHCPAQSTGSRPGLCAVRSPSQLGHKTPFVLSTIFPFLSLHSVAV